MRVNWTLDKILMGVLIFLCAKTYNSMEDGLSEVRTEVIGLKERTTLIEYQLDEIQIQLNKP